MSHKYEMDVAYADAIAGVDRSVKSPAVLVALGRRYNVFKWVHGHAKHLLTRDPASYSTEELEVLPPDIMKVILTTFQEKSDERMRMVCRAPPLHHGLGCRNVDTCGRKSWPALWYDGARLLVHRPGGGWVSGRIIFDKMLSVVNAIGSVGAPPSDLNKGCGQVTLDMIQRNNILWKDEDRQARAIEEIIVMCGVTPHISFDPFVEQVME